MSKDDRSRRSNARATRLSRPDRDGETSVLTQEKVLVQSPRMFRVLLHNDDFTTMDFVVEVLMRFFNKSSAEATRIMLQVHRSGLGVAGVYPRAVAETKVAEVLLEAERQQMPLLATSEPA